MTSKQRAYLKGLASTMEPVVHVGKAGASPEVVASASEALNARELIKISVLKNCIDDPKEIAGIISERTHSSIVHVIGKKIVLYKPNRDKPVIKLPLE
ncbi:MAG: ribosome assembly RNA-binding protein YhbY [Lachnospiraceae bacterium]|nr:ribosome assembly RNA-binding protein YhbY [Lachnospiraceae bacterium]